jgi:hypothetical protein
MFALADDTLIVDEPFNIEPRSYALDGLARYWFTYAPGLSQESAFEAFKKVLRRKTGRVFPRRHPQHWMSFTRRGRLLIKDPIAALSSEWISKNYDVQVVVLVRHPAAFAASLKRLQWDFPFNHLLDQRELMKEHLQIYREEIEEETRSSSDIVSRAALLWKCLYSVLITYIDRNPDWIVRRHESLSCNPVLELNQLYEVLGLKWTSYVESQIYRYTTKGNPVSAPPGVAHQMRRDSVANIGLWKEILTEEEVQRVYERTKGVSSRYYSEEYW